jgi:hypothetical protein
VIFRTINLQVMKRTIIAIFLTACTLMFACKGNPQGALGEGNKGGDTTVFDRKSGEEEGRTEASKDTSDKKVGPGKDEAHVTDSEHEAKH